MSYFADSDSGRPGYWQPHTSSVDFCEPNYHASSYLVEFHNSWSSLLLCWFAAVGMLYSNPTSEYRFACCYSVLFVIGLGSFALHATLHWIPQSSDEVPMLWQDYAILFALFEMKGKPNHRSTFSRLLPGIMITVVCVQTLIYYRYQQLYAVFLTTYAGLVVTIVFWTAYYLTETPNPRHRAMRWYIWIRSATLYVLIGTPLWLIDMHFCQQLTPFYQTTWLAGATLHIVWHFCAGLATYMTVVYLAMIRAQTLGKEVELRWIALCLPVCYLSDAPSITASVGKQGNRPKHE